MPHSRKLPPCPGLFSVHLLRFLVCDVEEWSKEHLASSMTVTNYHQSKKSMEKLSPVGC